MGARLVSLKVSCLVFFFSFPSFLMACEFVGLPHAEFQLVDQWVSEDGIQLCIARHDEYTLVIKTSALKYSGGSSSSVSEFLREYLEIELSEVEGPEQKKQWNKKRALLIGSLLDFKYHRVSLDTYKIISEERVRLPHSDPETTAIGQGSLELYFRRIPEAAPLLSDRFDF